MSCAPPAGSRSRAIYTDEPHADKVVEGLRGEIEEFCTALREGRALVAPVWKRAPWRCRVVESFYRAAAHNQTIALEIPE